MRFSNEYGYCELNDFPGCSQIVVSNHAFIYPEYRGKGQGKTNHLLRMKRATELGYDVMMATVKVGNVAEEKILIYHGWKQVHVFKNKNTGNEVGVWVKDLDRSK